MYNERNTHSFDMSIDNGNEIQLIERSSFNAAPSGPEGEPGFDCAGTFGSAGSFGGTLGSVGTFGCCC